MKLFCLLLLIFIINNSLSAQNFPFPQNSINPYGILPTNRNHIDVDSVYTNWKNNHVTSSGAGGFRRVVWDTLKATVSEGIAYGMLISVNMNDKLLFDDLWNYYQSHLDPTGLMIWIIDSLGNPLEIGGILVGTGAATDADQDAAYALLLANAQWGSMGVINYQTEAIALINKIYTLEIDQNNYMVKSGNEPGSVYRVNCSYFAPAYYRAFKYATGNSGWDSVRNAVYNFLNFRADSVTGIVPDWCLPNGDPMPPCPPPASCRFTYYYDATRTPFRIAMDYIWNGEVLAQNYCKKISAFIRTQGSENIVDEYMMNGTPLGVYHNNAFIGPFAVGTLATDSTFQTFCDSIYTENVEVFSGRWNYYNSSLKMLTLLMLTGNFIKAQYVLPVELNSFSYSIESNNVKLNWITSAEYNNSGFQLERKNNLENSNWKTLGFVNGAGSSNNLKEYNFLDKNLNSGIYKYRLKQIDFNGNYEFFNLSSDVQIGIPEITKLFNNYPNPFNPETNISFSLAHKGKISLKVFDITGKEVMNISEEELNEGYYTYKINMLKFPSGIYFYRLETGNIFISKKMILLK